MATAFALPFLAALGCGVLALAVGLRRERSAVASAALGLALALGLWNGGLGIAEAVAPGPWRTAALRVSVLAMFAAVGFWVLVALRHRWPRLAQGAPSAIAAQVPVTIFFVGAVTNASHGWFIVPGAEWDPGRVGWAGPATWALASLTFLYGLVGTAIFLGSGVGMMRGDDRRAGVGLTLTIVALPVVSLRLFDPDAVLPVAASTMTATMLVLALTALRYQLLEPPPLGHREVIDHLRHGVLMANAAGEVLDRNPAAASLLGFEPRGVSIAAWRARRRATGRAGASPAWSRAGVRSRSSWRATTVARWRSRRGRSGGETASCSDRSPRCAIAARSGASPTPPCASRSSRRWARSRRASPTR